MLAMAHTLLTEGLHDQAFLQRYTSGFEVFARYLRGETDGQPKHADWAAGQSGVDADSIREIARALVKGRSHIVVAHALPRAQSGAQPGWAGAGRGAQGGRTGRRGGG